MPMDAPKRPAEPVAEPTTIRRVQRGAAPAFALLAGMKLEVFTALADGPATAAETAARLGVDQGRLEPLLYGLVLTGLLSLAQEKFANSPEADVFLVKGRRRYLGGVHELWTDLWHADMLTADSIRNGRPQAKHDFVEGDREALERFIRGLSANALPRGRRLAKEFDFSGCRSVIDIGGGSGFGLIGLCEACAQLSATLYDLPPVAAIAQKLLRDTAYAGRIAVEAGDIVAAPPTSRHDAAIAMQVVQVLAPRDAATAIRHIAAAVKPGGLVMLVGTGVLDDSRLSPAAAVFINITFLNVYDDGHAYTEEQYFRWLFEAGCVAPRRRVLEDETSIIWATRGPGVG
jgi:cyclopropane fatty-acyl-phospholipid synthase-like methyltransferase